MKKLLRHTYSLLLLVVAFLAIITDWYDLLVIFLAGVSLTMLIDKMGKGIALRESIVFLYVITCLVMPLVGYTFYPYNNALAKLWVKYMPVAKEMYFGFALPAIACFSLALIWPLHFDHPDDEGKKLDYHISRVRQLLQGKKNIGLTILIVGVVAGIGSRFLPGALRFFGNLFFFSSFAGLLYVFYGPAFRYKKLALFGFAAFIFSNALASGMFTMVVYMSITIFSFFLLKIRLSFFRKVLVMLLAMSTIVVLQNAKQAYRKSVWLYGYQGNKLELFGKIFLETAQRGDVLVENKTFFPIYTRTNQGFNVALVMRRFPSIQEHDYGVNLLRTFAAAIVPRFLWPDKPEAGGKFNMQYYAGMTIVGYSTNVGPLGEAYGSFGVTGGIIYMFFLGFFIRWMYKKVFSIANKIPLLVCWIPVLFYQTTYSAETDTLQILNSVFKSAFFLLIIYKALPKWFGVVKRKYRFRRPLQPANPTIEA